jgi:hypothetical protein
MAYSKRPGTDADSRFARAQRRAEDGKKSLKEHEAEAARVNANTARLRALRLAKEASDRESTGRESEPTLERKKSAK